MTVTTMLDVLRGFLRRQWPIPLVAMVAAALVGYLAVGSVPDRHKALVEIKVDASALGRFPGLAGPEALFESVQEKEFIQEAAKRVGVSVNEYEEAANLYTGGPPMAFFVEYTGTDEAEAKRAASDLTEFVIEWQSHLSELDLEKQRTVVEESKQSLAVLEKGSSGLSTEWERSDLEYKLWNLRRELTMGEATLEAMENTYVVSGEPEITTLSGVRDQLTAAIGAALVGLFAGVLIAAVRDRRKLVSG